MIYEEDVAERVEQRKLNIPKEIIKSITIGHEVSKIDSDSIKYSLQKTGI